MSSLKKVFLPIFFICYILNFSQERKNVVGLELFGHSETIFSVNYERLFYSQNNNIHYSIRAGFGRNPGYDVNGKPFKGVTSIPIVFNVLYGTEHFIQLGLGYTMLLSENFIDTSINPNIVYKEFESDFSLGLGYRLMLNTGFVCYAYPILMYRDNPQKKFVISFGVEIGYSW
ncbi:MAG: hypothetical protein LBE36_04590 [Flavobacteriaceae bacterium]|jgi:hypothetical protein|nr:hypothetical protein [Flavobacteriaceae bacterium]